MSSPGSAEPGCPVFSVAVRAARARFRSRIALPLGGLYNVYNALAAVAATTALGIPVDATLRALEAATAAFGRQEAF